VIRIFPDVVRRAVCDVDRAVERRRTDFSASSGEQEVCFESGSLRLAGTLTLPAAGDAPWPAALLLGGSGPVDRNENWGLLRVDATRQLAHALALAGVASLRYDKRGVGTSDGGDWRAAGFFDAGDDAAAARVFLATRPELDSARIAAIGHSEGAFTATALVGRGEPLAAPRPVEAKISENQTSWPFTHSSSRHTYSTMSPVLY